MAVDGAGDTAIGGTIDGRSRNLVKQNEFQQQENEQQMNTQIPWQMEWKDPQWITSSPPSPTLADSLQIGSKQNDDEVVGITSAHLSPSEITQILSSGDSKVDVEPGTGVKSSSNIKEDHYLLTVTLLGRPSKKEKVTNGDDESNPANCEIGKAPKSFASEVLLEVVKAANSILDSDSNETSVAPTEVIRAKRLRWPESVFDDTATKNLQNKAATLRTSRSRRKRAKRKNLLASVFLPLMGIDEADEYDPADTEQRPRSYTNNDSEKSSVPLAGGKKPSVGIVSATLCRRPEEEQLARTKPTATKEIVELMSFGTSIDEGSGIMDHDNKRGNQWFEPNPSAEHRNIRPATEDSRLRQTQQQSNEIKNCGELSFVCVSQAGEIFVYDPIKLLLGIEDVSGLRDEERDAIKDLEGASTLFFGQELFQNLQETWKPLAEPSTRIHLSLFEYVQQKRHSGSNPKIPLENFVQSNQELSSFARSILSKDNQSTGSSKNEVDHSKGRLRRRIVEDGTRNNSGDSVSTYHSDDGGDASTIASSATDAFTVVQTMALELQTSVDEALSMLPYLLNPLLEPSTLKNRTIQNQPLDITVTGSAYVVVTGSGLQQRPQLNSLLQRRNSRGNTDAGASIESSPSYNNSATFYDSKEDSKDEDEILDQSTMNSTPQTDTAMLDQGTALVDEGQKYDKNDINVDDDNFCHTSNQDREITHEIEGVTEKDKWWEESDEAKAIGNAHNYAENNRRDDNAIMAAASKDSWWENESKIDLENDDSEKVSRDSPINEAIGNDEDDSQRHYFNDYVSEAEENEIREYGGFVTFLSTARWSETRTLFLPFVPLQTSHVPEWNGMELLWVIGASESLLIRMDSTGPVPVKIGDVMFRVDESDQEADIFQSVSASNRTNVTEGIGINNELSHLTVKKFQILPIDAGVSASMPPRFLCASTSGIKPASILELHADLSVIANKPKSLKDNISAESELLNEHHCLQEALVLLKTLSYCTPHGTVVLNHAPSHVAKIMIDQNEFISSVKENNDPRDSMTDVTSLWAEQGQGWSLVGSNRHIYFVCWEGSTLLQGAYVRELSHLPYSTSLESLRTTHILPLSKTRKNIKLETTSLHHHSGMVADERASPIESITDRDQFFKNPQRFSSAIASSPLTDKLHPPLSPNFEMISSRGASYALADSSKSSISSRRQYSEYLLQQCSSWTQLEDTSSDRIMLSRQEPVLCLRVGNAKSPHCMLSLRQIVVSNGVASPFQQVLAWLAKRKNYFVAAGIALDLLQDADTLYHLWKHAEMIDEENEETKLVGLLDGIDPVRLLDDVAMTNEHKHGVTATHLSEMTIGCFIKGGKTMSTTLEQFLRSNKFYDPERVSLMLARANLDLFSKIPVGGSDSDSLNFSASQEAEIYDEYLWPIKCLLIVGTEREYLNEVLTFLNNTIPDELRHRQSENETSTYPVTLTRKVIQLILESDPVALDILMRFDDYRSDETFWQSIDESTRLALFLMKVDSKFPFLGHPDSRSWVRGELDSCFQGQSNLPTAWLQELSFACLLNASCSIEDLLTVDHSNDHNLESTKSNTDGTTQKINALIPDSVLSNLGDPKIDLMEDHIDAVKFEAEKLRDTLSLPMKKGHGVDYDLLIPSLLLLVNRNAHWLTPLQLSTYSKDSSHNKERFVSTQSLLNSVCYFAGRTSAPSNTTTSQTVHSDEELFLFADFDGKSAMKQCYKAKNVVAGAHLVGGKNGFILYICDILNRGIEISIPDAESFLLQDRLDLKSVKGFNKGQKLFDLTEGHRKLLLLLDEHVLGIQTFGDFDFVHKRGRVDPVFAARSILRAWLSLSLDDKATASSWLGEWLRARLEIPTLSAASANTTPHSKTNANGSFDTSDDDNFEVDLGEDISPKKHRLACASLARSLLWANNKAIPKTSNADVDIVDASATGIDIEPLAATMDFDQKLLIQLCQSCLGLVESVPPAVVQEIKI